MIDSELPRNEDESESANFDKPIDRYEPEPNEELVGTFKPEPITGGRRYPLRERRAPTTYVMNIYQNSKTRIRDSNP